VVRRRLALLGAALVIGALLVPGTSSAEGRGAVSLRVAGGGSATHGPGSRPSYLPIHPNAFAKAKALANKRASARAHAHAAAPSAARTASGWDGQTQTDVTPPDPTGAIGPTRYVELVNLRFGIYDRNGSLISGGSLADLTGDANSLSDPQILWDPQTRHFYYVVLDFSTNEFDVGWSKDDSPSGPADFCKYIASFGYGSLYLPDYPKLGTSQDFLLIGVNVFLLQSIYAGSDVDWISKPPAGPLTTCPDPSGFTLGSFTSVKSADGSDATTPVPAVQTDPGPGWVVASPDASATTNANFLTLFQISGTKASGATIGSPTRVSVPPYNVPASAPQNGGPTIDTMDARLTRAVSGIDPLRGNTQAVWTQHAVFGGAGSEERWYEIDPSAGTLLQSGTASSQSLYVWNGAVSPDRAVDGGTTAFGGDMVMGFNTSSSSTYPAIQMVTKAGTDPQSSFTMVKQSPGVNEDYSCSFPYGPPCRWGDYSGASADPTPDLSCPTGAVWLSGEWNVASTDPSGTDWRTWNWQALPASCTPTSPTVPGAPTLTSATAGDTVVDLAWTPPASDGGSAVAVYNVYRGTSSGGETPLATGVSGTTYHDTAVTNDTTYFYEVTAVNAIGEGPLSNERSATPSTAAVPGAPSLSGTALRGGGVRLTWAVPSDGGSPITGYKIYRGTKSGGETLQAIVGTVTSYTDGSTRKNVTYWYYVKAVNAVGDGPASNEVKVRSR
jgi:hypothetical protein